MKKYILNPISLFFIGAILGIISKLLDILFVGNLFMMTLGYMFSDLPIWVLLGILISIYSDTRKKAMINIFPFCIGMLISYYVTAELTNAVYSWNSKVGQYFLVYRLYLLILLGKQKKKDYLPNLYQ